MYAFGDGTDHTRHPLFGIRVRVGSDCDIESSRARYRSCSESPHSDFLLPSFLTYSLHNITRVSADASFQSLHFLIIIFCIFGFLVFLSLNLSILQTQKWHITVMTATRLHLCGHMYSQERQRNLHRHDRNISKIFRCAKDRFPDVI